MLLKLIKRCHSIFFYCVWLSLGQCVINLSNFDCAKCHRNCLYVRKRIFKFYLANRILRCSHNKTSSPTITFLFSPTSGHNPKLFVVPNAIETPYMFPFEFYNLDWLSLFSSLNSIRLMNKNTKQK